MKASIMNGKYIYEKLSKLYQEEKDLKDAIARLDDLEYLEYPLAKSILQKALDDKKSEIRMEEHNEYKEVSMSIGTEEEKVKEVNWSDVL